MPPLAALGRQHSAAEAIAALETARAPVPAPVLRSDLRPPRPDACRPGGRNCARRWRSPPTICRSTSSPSSPAPAFEALHRRGRLVLPDDDTAAALYDATGEEAAALRPAGLRGVELRPARRGKPPQPALLALRRLRRHRPRRAWPDHARRHAAGHPPPPRPGTLGRAGGTRTATAAPRKPPVDAAGPRPRGAADGPAPVRGHRRRPVRRPHRRCARRRARPLSRSRARPRQATSCATRPGCAPRRRAASGSTRCSPPLFSETAVL